MVTHKTKRNDTVRKRLEALLQESEDRFRTLADAAPLMIWMTDEKGNCNYCNSRKLVFTGIPLSGHLGLGWTECIHPEDKQQSYNSYLTALNARSNFQIEYRLLRADGEYRWILDTGVPRITCDGNFIGYISTAIDITAQKEAESALKTTQNLWQTIVENISFPIFVKDTSGRYVLVNSAAASTVNLKPEELIGKDDTQIFTPEIASRLKESDRLLIANGTTQNFSEVLKVNGVQKIYVTSKSLWRDEQGNILGIVGILREGAEYFQTESLTTENSYSLLQTVIESIPDTFYVKDIYGRYVLINSAGVACTGKSVEEFIGKDDTQIFPPELARQIIENDRRILTTGKPQIVEEIAIKKGITHTYLSHKNVWRDSKGNIIGLVGFTQDITDRKRGEATLKQQARILDQLCDSVITTDLNGIVTRWNKAAELLYGYPAAEAIGQSIIFLYPPEQREFFPREVLPILQKQGVYEGEIQGKRKDGEIIDVLINISMERNEQGEVVGMIGYAIDITERKRLENERQQQEAALRESEERFRAIMEQAAVGMAATRADSKLLWLNQKFCDLVGYTKEELETLTYTEITHPDDWEGDREFMAKALAGEPLKSREKRYIRKDGSIIWVNLTLSIVRDEAGIPKYDIAVIEDISDRKALEKELALRQARFDAFFSAAPAGLVIHDEHLNYVQINQKLAEMNGLSVADFLGKNLSEILPDMAPTLKPMFRHILATGVPVLNIEIGGETSNQPGVERHWIASYFPLPGEDNTPLGVGGVIFEISDRKALEKELALRQARFDAFFTEAPAGMAIFDEELRYVQINPTLAEKNGLSVSDHIGKTLHEILPPAASILKPMLRRILTTGEPVINNEGSGENPRFPGLVSHWVASFFPLPGEDNQPQAIGVVAVDITERKQAEKALQESLERFELVSQVSLDGIWDSRYIWDEKGIPHEEVYYSPRLKELIGFKERELENISESYISRIHSEDRDRVISALNAHKINRVPYQDIEYRILTSNGEYRWVSARGQSQRDEQDRVVRFIGSIRDITERKQAEEALRKSEELYRILIENFPDGSVFLFDRDRRFLVAGGSELAKAGLDPVYLEGKTPLEIWPPEDYQPFDHLYVAALKGEFLRCETPYHDVIYLTQAVPIRNSFGEIFGGFLIVQNITDRKRAEQALQESANRLELLNKITSQIRASLDLDTILDTVVNSIRDLLEIDACTFSWYRPNLPVDAGNEEGVWELIKEAKIPDLPSFIGTYPASAVAPLSEKSLKQEILWVDDAETVSEPILHQTLLSYNCLSMLTVPFQTQGGEIASITCSNHISNKRHWSESEVELLRGITDTLAIAISQAEIYKQSQISAEIASERALQLEQALQELQRTQTQLIQSEKMSSLGQLVAGVAHEINNPVSFIYGNINPAREYISDLLHLIELYQLEYPNPTPAIKSEIEAIDLEFLVEDLPKLLDSMKVGADRIREIVLSLRNFSRMDEAQIKDVDIHEGINSTLRLLQNRMKAKPDHPEIEVIQEYEKLPLIECYAGQLNQVFMNLLVNAIDALDERDKKRSISEIKANPSRIKITTFVLGNERIVISIADNGPGIPESVKARIFDPFFTTKPVGKGTGLGLAISYQIVVEKHFGSLRCNSVPGKGTEFVMEIPIRQGSK